MTFAVVRKDPRQDIAIIHWKNSDIKMMGQNVIRHESISYLYAFYCSAIKPIWASKVSTVSFTADVVMGRANPGRRPGPILRTTTHKCPQNLKTRVCSRGAFDFAHLEFEI